MIAISGSAGAIGSAVAARVRLEGFEILGIDLHDAEILRDLSTAEGRADAVAEMLDRSGGSLDAFVASAGVSHARSHREIVEVNYISTVELLDAARPLLRSGKLRAAVVLVSNSAGYAENLPHAALAEYLLAGETERFLARTADLPGGEIYALSKLALAWSLRARTLDWFNDGIRLNGIAPGPIDTPLLAEGGRNQTPRPIPTVGQPADVADPVWFLLSNAARLVHGSIVFADAGLDALARPHGL